MCLYDAEKTSVEIGGCTLDIAWLVADGVYFNAGDIEVEVGRMQPQWVSWIRAPIPGGNLMFKVTSKRGASYIDVEVRAVPSKSSRSSSMATCKSKFRSGAESTEIVRYADVRTPVPFLHFCVEETLSEFVQSHQS